MGGIHKAWVSHPCGSLFLRHGWESTNVKSPLPVVEMPKQAVLLLAHGTPETIEQIPEYLRNVVSGRPLPQALIEEIQHRYARIGHSPLTEITFAQARLVQEGLAAAGHTVPVYVGMRNWRPYIPEVVRQMRADGIEE